MREIILTKRFRKDYKKLKYSGRRKMKKLHAVMDQLIEGKFLHPKHADHQLSGKWRKYRDCHIEGDWILVYEIMKNEEGSESIIFHASDTHSNLFQ